MMSESDWAIFFQGLIPVWGIIGLLVCWTYGRVSHTNWRDAGGSWTRVPFEWTRVIGYVIGGCIYDLWCLARYQRLLAEPPFQMRYKAGHLLQLFVVFSFSMAAISGAFMWSADRTGWSTMLRCVTVVSITLSVLAGWGHLFLAWRSSPRRWRWVVLLSVMAVLLNYVLRA